MFRGGLDAARAAGPACLLVLVALAGCATDAGEVTDDEGSLKADIVDGGASTPTGEEAAVATTGRVEGVVLHPTGFPLPDARVTVLSVDHSMATGRDGMFAFDKVEAGGQVLRVEKETYKTLQKPFQVVAGKVTKIEVVLTSVDEGGFSEHYHNHWRGLDTYEVFKDTVKLDDDISQVPPRCTYPHNYDASCSSLDVRPAEGRIVPPGTSNVTIEIEFEPGPVFDMGMETMYLYVQPPPDAEGKQYNQFYLIQSGSTHIEYELPSPDIVDNGHATWTDWRFELYWSTIALAGGAAYNTLFTSPVDITITAHKGTLELDPPHERHWQDTDRIVMEKFSEPSSAFCNGATSTAAGLCGLRVPNPTIYTYSDGGVCYYGCMVLGQGEVIPLGTTRVAFTVEHYWADAPVPQVGAAVPKPEFIIGYKTAAAPANQATWDDYTWLEPKETVDTDQGVAWSYEVEVQEDETDLYYARTSKWVLMAAVPGHEDADTWEGMDCPFHVCGRAYFRLLDFVAINDDRDEMVDGAA